MKFLKDANWGLKLLALILAIVVYHAMKSDSGNNDRHDRHLFKSR
jgi:YbbR domain-containing protein